MSESILSIPHAATAHQGNLLSSAVRRDVADLNRLFLANALDPVHRDDCWFQLPLSTIRRLEHAAPEAIERAAWAPVALFELILPPTNLASPCRTGEIGDVESSAIEHFRGETRRSFALVALGVLRRLAEGVPYASRIAFGLASTCEQRLSSLSPSEAFRLASWAGLVRPRWPGHARYWSMLAGAAAGTAKEDLYWAYSAGLCLLGQCERDPTVVRFGGSRRARPMHRRVTAEESDVPC